MAGVINAVEGITIRKASEMYQTVLSDGWCTVISRVYNNSIGGECLTLVITRTNTLR